MFTKKCFMFARVIPNLCSTTSCLVSTEILPCTYIRKRHFKFSAGPITRKDNFSKFQHKNLIQSRLQSTSSDSDDVTIVYRHGLPVITVTLPSRHERCSFTLRPLLSTVGQFLNDLKSEDKGIDTAVIYGSDGSRVASSTQIEHLLSGNFKLTINNVSYNVEPPPSDKASSEHITEFDDLKQVIARLYNNLNVDQYCLQQEQQVLGRLEELRTQLEPLEKVKKELEDKANFRTNLLVWGGLAYMAAQFGVLARLTWWEYSWDIMEPVTYFITYGTAILMYGYFILTKQEMMYPDARDRQFLRFLHKAADKSKFDVAEYNSLQNKLARAEEDLKKLKEPLRIQTPTSSQQNKIKDS
ncbi:calcium uniporter protein, mitochondrial-like [Styela clava]